jgi:hypothetical protein
MTKDIVPLQSYLTRNSLTKTLMRKREQQLKLLRDVEQLLPDSLAGHCLAAAREQGRLVLFVDAPVWASRMRFLAPDIARQLQGKHGQMQGVKIRVLPTRQCASPPRKRPTARLSSSTRLLLVQVAAGIADPSLKSALERLARIPTKADPESE